MMDRKQLQDKIAKLSEYKDKFLREANVELGRIEGQILMAQELLKEDEGGQSSAADPVAGTAETEASGPSA